MDITSYLLGKNSSGGGGGGGLDWSAIGYDSTPQAIIDGYNYAKQIQEEWVPIERIGNKFKENNNIIFMPKIDTSITTNFAYAFNNCMALITIPLLDTSNVTSFSSCFSGCYALKEVPLLDTSNVTTFEWAFASCYSLKEVPQFNTSKVTNFSRAFYSSNFLSDQSLVNVLKMCTNATSYTGTKTLVTLGFSSSKYPVSRIEALPSYQAFLDAGWTIGY